jgi:hypothetical protein
MFHMDPVGRNGVHCSMSVETALSVAMLAGFIWAIRFLLPRAIHGRDGMAIVCAALTAIVALLVWLLVGVSIRSVT